MKSIIIFCLVYFFASPGGEMKSPGNAVVKSCFPNLSMDTSVVDMKALADSIVGKRNLSSYEKVRMVIDWTNKNFEWTATDYKKRTAMEVIDRKGGNCNEQAMVVRELLKELNVPTRRIREINIQPERESRQKNAEEKVKEQGLRYSVFGYRHNDHVWIEFYDEKHKSWVPADPTLGLVGMEQWLKARIGFEERPVHNILPSRDMLVPIAIIVQDDKKGDFIEDRSTWYLVSQFNAVYNGKLEKEKEWREWVSMINYISPKCKGAFEGKVNLHEYTDSIARIKTVYLELKQDYLSKNKTSAITNENNRDDWRNELGIFSRLLQSIE